jgi:hypothetical protein
MRHTHALALAAVLASSSLSAGELSLLIDKQFGKAQTTNLALLGLGKSGQYDAVSPTGYGIRAGFSVLDLKVAEIGLELTYHTKAEGDVILAGVNTHQKLSTQYFALGAKAEWKFLMNFYAGLELRAEKLETPTESVTYTRPWVKAGVGMSLPIPVLAPFARLEFAMPTAKHDTINVGSDMLKALAPQYQVAACVGIRF